MFNAKESDSEHRLNIKINNLLKQKKNSGFITRMSVYKNENKH